GRAPLRAAPRRARGGDPDRGEIAHHLRQPGRGAHADAGTRPRTRHRGQRPVAHVARAAAVPAAGHRRARFAAAPQPLPLVAHAVGIPRARNLFLPPRPVHRWPLTRYRPCPLPTPRNRRPSRWSPVITPRSTAATGPACCRGSPTTWSTTSTRGRGKRAA